MSSTELDALTQLEWRLSRVEFHLRGDDAADADGKPATDGAPPQQQDTISARLARIEERLFELREQSPAADGLLKLQAEQPQLFRANTDAARDAGLTDDDKLQVVLASAETFASTTSGLSSIKENPFPDGAALTELVALEPRIARAQQALERQNAQLDELRRRSATVLARWYTGAVLRGGQEWAECEERLLGVEQAVLRREKARQRDEGAA